MRRWHLILVIVLLGVAAFITWLVIATSADEDPAAADGRQVYCLASQRRAELIDAATYLRLAGQGTSAGTLAVRATPGAEAKDRLSPADWSATRRADFDRACAAVVESARIASGGGAQAASGGGQTSLGLLLTTLIGLIPVVIGGVIAWAGGELRARAAGAQLRAQALEDAAAAFDRTSRALLEAWSAVPLRKHPDNWPVQERLADLDLLLRRCAAERPGWPFVVALRTEVADLGALLRSDDWRRIGDAARRARAEELLPRLERLKGGLTRLAAGMEQPRRYRSKMTAIELGELAGPSDPRETTP